MALSAVGQHSLCTSEAIYFQDAVLANTAEASAPAVGADPADANKNCLICTTSASATSSDNSRLTWSLPAASDNLAVMFEFRTSTEASGVGNIRFIEFLDASDVVLYRCVA